MKKVLVAVVCFFVLGVSVFAGVGFSTMTKESPHIPVTGEGKNIVYLGDSIAEAIAGPSPLSEREDYGYYGVIGQRNLYNYYNRAVSGHQTKNMLKYLDVPDEETGAKSLQSAIKNADIIHVSILGNDLLQNGMGALLVDMKRGDETRLNNILTQSKVNFAAIVKKLKEKNPTAVLMFQTVYNPVYPDTMMLGEEVRVSLSYLGVTSAEYRDMGAVFLTKLNNIVHDYLAENPGSYYIMDAFKEFQRLEDAEPGKVVSLIAEDGVHPSSEGHAVLADLTQRKLEELGLADKANALKKYKELRIEQLERMFSKSLNVAQIKEKINSATTCEEVTSRYFKGIKGAIPVYAVQAKAKKLEKGETHVSEETTFSITNGTVLGLTIWAIASKKDCSVVLKEDGTIEMSLIFNGLATHFLFSFFDIDVANSAAMEDFAFMYARPYFPGFDFNDLEASLGLIRDSVGVGLANVDFDDPNIIALQDALSGQKELPEDFSLPAGLGLKIKSTYYIKDVQVGDKTYKGIFVGKHKKGGEPFLVMTLGENAETGKQEIDFRWEVLSVYFTATEK